MPEMLPLDPMSRSIHSIELQRSPHWLLSQRRRTVLLMLLLLLLLLHNAHPASASVPLFLCIYPRGCESLCSARRETQGGREEARRIDENQGGKALCASGLLGGAILHPRERHTDGDTRRYPRPREHDTTRSLQLSAAAMSEFLASSSSGGQAPAQAPIQNTGPRWRNGWCHFLGWWIWYPWMEDGFPGWKQASERAGLVS